MVVHQMPDNYQTLLDTAASRFGVETGYWDIWGNRHETTPAVKAALLTSLGLDTSSETKLADSLQQLDAETVNLLTPPVTVLLQSDKQELAINASAATGRLTLTLENGQTSHHNFKAQNSIALPENLPLGVHQVKIEIGENTTTSRLIICPDRCWIPNTNHRTAGLAISLYGVHSANTWGCGDFTTLRSVIHWAATKLECSYIALNPLQAIHNRQPFNTSPYLPNSTLYRNLIYLDIDAIPEMPHSRWAQHLRASPRILANIAELNQSEFVEYEKVQTLKLGFLRCLFRTFLQREWNHNTTRAQQFRQFIDTEGEQLDLFATYCTLDAHIHRTNPNIWVWPDWPIEFHNPASEQVNAFKNTHRRTILFHKYVQWLLDTQAEEAQTYARAQGLSIGLFHDLPLATDRCGFELWANRAFYIQGCRVGSPPDDFAPNGQDWGFPPPNTIQHQRDGYRLFAESIRKSAKHGGALRLDHVMRLFRLFWIPDGVETAQGTYVQDNAKELLSVLALESHRSKIVIVGEDLGTIAQEMRDMLNRFGVLSYRLFFFERNADGSFKAPDEYPDAALVSSTTHDLPTLAGFWAGRDIELRRSLGVLDAAAAEKWKQQRQQEKQNMLTALIAAGLLKPELAAAGPELTGEVHNAIIGFLANTPAQLLTINQEDLTKEIDQQNLPGTTWEYPNWRRKMKFSVEDLWTERTADDFATMLRNWLAQTRRSRLVA